MAKIMHGDIAEWELGAHVCEFIEKLPETSRQTLRGFIRLLTQVLGKHGDDWPPVRRYAGAAQGGGPPRLVVEAAQAFAPFVIKRVAEEQPQCSSEDQAFVQLLLNHSEVEGETKNLVEVQK